jgi:hypothetical protein
MPDDLAPGEIYTDHVCKLLDAEYDRRKVLEARGDSIIKTSSGIIALIFALAVFISGKDYKFTNHWNSIWFLVCALIAFISSAGIAIYVQNWALRYRITGKRTLGKMTQEFWDLPADDAQRMCLQRYINTTLSLRQGNDKKVAAAQYSVIFQVIAIMLLSISLVCELAGHR